MRLTRIIYANFHACQMNKRSMKIAEIRRRPVEHILWRSLGGIRGTRQQNTVAVQVRVIVVWLGVAAVNT